MDGPPTTTGANHVKLFSMDGLLVGAEFFKEHIGLWFLIDNYGDAANRWELRHRVAKPWGHYVSSRSMLSLSMATDEGGNVMLGDKDGLVVYNVRKKETVKTIDSVETGDNKCPRVQACLHGKPGAAPALLDSVCCCLSICTFLVLCSVI
jgi:hypothetical protein